MSKILVLGNETTDTDNKTTLLANAVGSTNHGLISDPKFIPYNDGYYHTTVVDLSPGEIVRLSEHFNKIIMLDQKKESYPHYKSLVTTVRLMYDLELAGKDTVYKENDVAKNLVYWREFLQKNKSFCYYPFISMVNDTDSTSLCPKNLTPLTKIDSIVDWETDPAYTDIRNKMLNGELIPSRCSDCYDREAEGQESTRQFETLEWAEKIKATSVNDFIVKGPLYYEIRPSNKCNIMCRTCDDVRSHLIEAEWKTIGIPVQTITFSDTPFDKIDFSTVQRIYVGGGEPTVMPEFYDFLRKCIDNNKTDFELVIGTNGMKFSERLLNLLDHFSDVCLSVSFDGYDKINDYIRWKSDFNTVVTNSKVALARGNKISVQTVFSIFSISRMHEIFEFYDREFPKSGLLVNIAGGLEDIFMPYHHPRPDLVVESMKKCQQTNVYYMNGRSVKSMVDLILDFYSNPNYKVDTTLLRKFFEHNDKLDAARGSKLGDYLPELEEGRALCTKFLVK